jgi:hypothetical protein
MHEFTNGRRVFSIGGYSWEDQIFEPTAGPCFLLWPAICFYMKETII